MVNLLDSQHTADGTAPLGAPRGAQHKVSTTTSLLYGLGSVGYGVKLQALSSLLLLFFNQVIGLPATSVGLVLMGALVVDSICDPLIGQWSDNTRSRWGRRHPFMYFSALPASVAFYLLWRPPADWSQPALIGYLAACLVVLRVVITCYETPSAALAPELAPGYDTRTRLFSYRYLFQSVGGLAMTTLTYLVLLRPTAKYPNGILNRDGYQAYGLIGALIIFSVILISAFGTHREIPYLNQPPVRRLGFRAMIGEMATTLSDRNFLVISLSVLISAVSLGVIGALSLYINSYYWRLPPAAIGLVVGIGLVSTAVGVVLGPMMAARFGKKPTALTAFAASLVAGVAPLVAGVLGLAPAPGSTALVAVLMTSNALAGVFSTAGSIAVVSMLADVVEENQVRTGRRSEGLLLSSDNLIQKSIAGFGIFLSGLLLSHIGFPAKAVPGQVDPAILRHLVDFYLPVVVVLSCISISTLAFYKIDRSRHEDNLRRLSLTPPPESWRDPDPAGEPSTAPGPGRTTPEFVHGLAARPVD